MIASGVSHDPLLRLVCAVLLKACDDARRDARALHWVQHSERARDWALAIGLERWPPRAEQLAGRRELLRRLADG